MLPSAESALVTDGLRHLEDTKDWRFTLFDDTGFNKYILHYEDFKAMRGTDGEIKSWSGDCDELGIVKMGGREVIREIEVIKAKLVEMHDFQCEETPSNIRLEAVYEHGQMLRRDDYYYEDRDHAENMKDWHFTLFWNKFSGRMERYEISSLGGDWNGDENELEVVKRGGREAVRELEYLKFKLSCNHMGWRAVDNWLPGKGNMPLYERIYRATLQRERESNTWTDVLDKCVRDRLRT